MYPAFLPCSDAVSLHPAPGERQDLAAPQHDSTNGYSDAVTGADTGGGHYVMFDQDELDAVAPGRSLSMDIRTFVDLGDMDPIYFDKTYYLGPGGEDTGKVYALLLAAMGDSDKATIARALGGLITSMNGRQIAIGQPRIRRSEPGTALWTPQGVCAPGRRGSGRWPKTGRTRPRGSHGRSAWPMSLDLKQVSKASWKT
jgi:Ku70/Ku80 beta-barrel domain